MAGARSSSSTVRSCRRSPRPARCRSSSARSRIGAVVMIDGGITNPLPFDRAAEHADIVIAVDVIGGPLAQSPPFTGLDRSHVRRLPALHAGRHQREAAARPAARHPRPHAPANGYRVLDFMKAAAIIKDAEPLKDEPQATSSSGRSPAERAPETAGTRGCRGAPVPAIDQGPKRGTARMTEMLDQTDLTERAAPPGRSRQARRRRRRRRGLRARHLAFGRGAPRQDRGDPARRGRRLHRSAPSSASARPPSRRMSSPTRPSLPSAPSPWPASRPRTLTPASPIRPASPEDFPTSTSSTRRSPRRPS